MSMSGMQLKGFTKGWATAIYSFGPGHYFRRIGMTDEVISSCGVRSAVRAMYGIGTWATCKKCRRKHGAPTDVRTCIDQLQEGSR